MYPLIRENKDFNQVERFSHKNDLRHSYSVFNKWDIVCQKARKNFNIYAITLPKLFFLVKVKKNRTYDNLNGKSLISTYFKSHKFSKK